MLLVKLDTGFNIEVEFALSPFHRRFFAWLIDATIQGTYLFMAAKLLNALVGLEWDSQIWIFVLYLLPFIFYHLISEIMMNGQSVGKMVMQIKVMTLQGGEPSISQYLIRWLFRIIDFPILLFAGSLSGYSTWWVVLFIFAGLICVIATPKSQRVGDLVAGTILIDLKKRTSWQDTVFTEVESTYQPRYPQVMQLSDRDVNTLKNIIETVKRRNDYDLSIKIAYRIQSKLKMTSDQDSLEFLQTLLKDYNYYSTN
ncbi:hypothetical protein A4D02_22605 [Niastella koreensis]|uniref:RDD domain containing protein n=2 Tax=Niastella koreensis TaxID=354356 RepID=G8TEE7_NIAKG|nr:RDD family protein [Niastella koreensis]AEV98357.1 RDD domain containing protein [Niastella koreensis GR20-10]OQP53189.1 hypothetical protein A4D02_22605 [Niastella koreensis]